MKTQKPYNLTLSNQMPPQNEEIEKAVLGAIILEPKAYLKISDILTIQSFYKESHQKIMGAVQDLFLNNQNIDLLTVTNQLHKVGQLDAVGGAYYVSTLSERVASASHIESHAMEIADLWVKRRLIELANEMTAKGFDPQYSTDDLIGLATSIVEKATTIAAGKSEIQSFDFNLRAAIDYINDKQNFKKKDRVVPILKDLRKFIPEWNTGEVVIIAGRPGMAKTSYALFEIYEQAKNGHAGAFFSLEMQTDRLVNKCIQAETGLTSYDYERQLTAPEWEDIDNVYTAFHKLPIFIDDTPLATLTHIKSKAKLLKERYNIRFIVIDYLQLMGGGRTKNSTREEFISEISRNMKALSKELDVTIFVLSQLNRGVESRSDKRPALSDLRESGAIEQDADIVLFPFRGEYYWPNIPELERKGIIIVSKNRNGSTGDAHMEYNTSVTKFMDIQESFTPVDRNSSF